MKSILGIAVALALTACATSNPNVVPVYGAQRMSQVYDATAPGGGADHHRRQPERARRRRRRDRRRHRRSNVGGATARSSAP
jgi:hypothetical protein